MKTDKRKEILDIAAKLFGEKGFENTSTRDISREAGLSNAGIYYYFDSKEFLLYEILNEILSRGLEAVRKIDGNDASYEEKFKDFAKFYTRYYSPEINKLKLLVEEQKKVNQEHKKRLGEIQREYLDILIRILDGLKREARMADMDTRVCAFAFFSMVHWVYRWYNPKGTVSPEHLSEMFYRILNQGIRPHEE